MQHVENLRSRE